MKRIEDVEEVKRILIEEYGMDGENISPAIKNMFNGESEKGKYSLNSFTKTSSKEELELAYDTLCERFKDVQKELSYTEERVSILEEENFARRKK